MASALPAGLVPAGAVADVRLDRTLAFACAGILAAINGEATQLIEMLRWAGWLGTVSGLAGISAVIWFALFAALEIGLEASPAPLRQGDWLVLGGAMLLALLPVSLLAPVGLLLAGTYLTATSTRSNPDRRLGIVLLALTGPLLWGRIILHVLVAPLVTIDAHLVGLVIGSPVEGNTLFFAEGGRRFMVGGPCSSVHNISIGILLWTTALALFKLRLDRRLVGIGFATMAFMFCLNIARLSAIGLFPKDFVFLHVGLGATLFGWAGLSGAALIVAWGVNDAVARQR